MDNYDEDYNDDIEELAKNFLDSIDNDEQIFFDIDELFDIFAHFNKNADTENLKKVYEIAQDLYPDDFETKLMEAQICLNNQKFKQVIKILKNTQGGDDEPEYYLTLAPAYAELQKHDEAVKCYLKALEYIDEDDKPFVCDIHLEVALEYMNIDKFEEAADHLYKSIEDDKLLAEKYLSLYNCSIELNTVDKLIDFMLQRIKDNPYDNDAYFTLANIYADRDDSEESIKALEMSLGIDPQQTHVYYLLIDELQNAERYNDAIEYCLDALNNNVIDPPIYNKISYLYLLLNQPDKALYHLHQAAKQFPDSSTIYESLGLCYDRIGDLENAIKYLKKSIKLGESFNSKLNLAIIYLNQGQHLDECHKLLTDLEAYYLFLPLEEKFTVLFNNLRLFICDEKFQEGLDYIEKYDLSEFETEDIVKLSLMKAYCHYRSGQRDEALFIIETFAYDYPELFSFFWSWDSLSLVKDEELVRIKIKVETIISDRYEESLENEPEDDSE